MLRYSIKSTFQFYVHKPPPSSLTQTLFGNVCGSRYFFSSLLGGGAGVEQPTKNKETSKKRRGDADARVELPSNLDRSASGSNNSYESYFKRNGRVNIPLPPVSPERIEFSNAKGMSDEFHWLKNLDDDRVIEYINKENQYLEQYMSQPLQKRLKNSIRSVFKGSYLEYPQDDNEVIDGYVYYKEGGSYYRKRNSDGFIQLLFKTIKENDKEYKEMVDGDDVNNKTLARYLNLKINDLVSIKFSENQELFAYIADTGDEEFIAVVKRIDADQYKSEVIEIIENVLSIEWGRSNDLYYTTRDHIKRPDKIYKKVITNTSDSSLNSELIFHEPNESNLVEIVKSKDSNYLFFCSNNKLSTLIYYIDLRLTNQKPKIILNRKDGLEYYVEHNDDRFIVFANFDKNDLSIYSLPDKIENGTIEDLKPLVLTESGLCIRDVDLYRDKMVLHELFNSNHRLRVLEKNLNKEFSDDESHAKIINFEQVCKIQLGVNNSDKDKQFRLYKQSPIEPVMSYDYNLDTNEFSAVGSPPIIHGDLLIKRSDYVTSKVFVPSSHDPNVQVPLSLVHHKDLVLDGKNPCVVKGYGSYGTPLEAEFDLEDTFLLKSGWVIALAHVRGGGELGRNWYEEGRVLKKHNTFNDFVDCVKYLFDSGYTSPDYLIGKGGSAGGLLMAFVAINYPHYFSGIVAKVPFVDVLNTMLDESLPLTLHEQGEWGDPITDETVLNYIKTYDPYILVDKLYDQKHSTTSNGKILPNLYLTCSVSDFRVPYWQPLRFMAKLRNYFTNNPKESIPLLLLHIQHDTGHFGPKQREQYYETISNEFTFMINSIHLSNNNK